MNCIVKNVRIKSIATCLPANSFDVFDNKELYKDNRAKLEKIVKVSGFHIRHVLPKNSNITASDLCCRAAEQLLQEEDRASISALIFVSGTPDYVLLSTSSQLQSRLNLSEHIFTLDIMHGCAGMVSGLLVASKLVSKENSKILLLVGNTLSKIHGTGEDAKIDPPYYGDGGSAILLEYDENADPMYFNSGTKSDDCIRHSYGGFKNPPTKDMFKVDGTFDYGSFSDGLALFQFSISTIPHSIEQLLKFAKISSEEIDYFVLHQSNISTIKNIARILHIPIEKVPYTTLPKYGNLGSASIASVLTDMSDVFSNSNYKIVISGFGIGLAWTSAILTFKDVTCYPTIFMEV